ncbi:MAG: putative nosL family protein [Deltaproteobacteria bacterium]|nr:putative nosL family protein [Deltaproteobacteria bacterium]
MDRLGQLLLLIIFCISLDLTDAIAAPAKASAPSARDKCPVCGMFVAKFPNWVASSRLKDGTTYFFDGPKDMFTHYFDTQRYTPGKRQADIVTQSVKEYYSLQMIDAKSAFYVSGSNVYGPMGSELIPFATPFATEKDAASFMNDHKGKRILRFQDITPAIIKALP